MLKLPKEIILYIFSIVKIQVHISSFVKLRQVCIQFRNIIDDNQLVQADDIWDGMKNILPIIVRRQNDTCLRYLIRINKTFFKDERDKCQYIYTGRDLVKIGDGDSFISHLFDKYAESMSYKSLYIIWPYIAFTPRRIVQTLYTAIFKGIDIGDEEFIIRLLKEVEPGDCRKMVIKNFVKCLEKDSRWHMNNYPFNHRFLELAIYYLSERILSTDGIFQGNLPSGKTSSWYVDLFASKRIALCTHFTVKWHFVYTSPESALKILQKCKIKDLSFWKDMLLLHLKWPGRHLNEKLINLILNQGGPSIVTEEILKIIPKIPTIVDFENTPAAMINETCNNEIIRTYLTHGNDIILLHQLLLNVLDYVYCRDVGAEILRVGGNNLLELLSGDTIDRILQCCDNLPHDVNDMLKHYRRKRICI